MFLGMYYVFILHKPLLSNVDFYASLRPFLIIKKILHLPRRLNNVRSHRLRRKLFISNNSFHKVTQMTCAAGRGARDMFDVNCDGLT